MMNFLFQLSFLIFFKDSNFKVLIPEEMWISLTQMLMRGYIISSILQLKIAGCNIRKYIIKSTIGMLFVFTGKK